MQAKTKISKIDQVCDFIHQQIKLRHLLPNSRLPSIRKLAQQLNFSVSTVVEAYERLIAQGKIEAKQGAGYYVTAPTAPLSLITSMPKVKRDIDPLWISRQSLEAEANVLKPGCGWLPQDWLPQEVIRKAMRNCIQHSSRTMMEYAAPQGMYELRQLCCLRMQQKRIEVQPEQMLLVDSATQAIDLLCRFFLKPNDCVLVDDPCYFNFQALLKVHQVQVIGIPYTKDGVDVSTFEQAILQHRPRLYITNSAIHNPTGAILSIQTAHQVLRLIEQHHMLLIEDDIYADFENEHAPRYSALDGLNHVIYISSFSKTLSASVRCGFIALRQAWIDDLIYLKIATQLSHQQFSSEVVYAALTDGGYRKHLEQIKLRLNQHMSYSIKALAELDIYPWHTPTAGMFLWCELPQQMDAGQLSQMCLEKGMVLAPGNSFSTSQRFQHFVRFNVSRCQPEIFTILKEVMQTLK